MFPYNGMVAIKHTPILAADQREICFNYNGNRGCTNHVSQCTQ
ncbi:unnamed protein product, partial [Rotaria socialis]